ncbi:MAG: DUF1049 domain-containing protein [Dehalococcoidia bacterium]|nr:DUF1049 domain-containing protein [Dehalococcoidia bacterium]
MACSPRARATSCTTPRPRPARSRAAQSRARAPACSSSVAAVTTSWSPPRCRPDARSPASASSPPRAGGSSPTSRTPRPSSTPRGIATSLAVSRPARRSSRPAGSRGGARSASIAAHGRRPHGVRGRRGVRAGAPNADAAGVRFRTQRRPFRRVGARVNLRPTTTAGWLRLILSAVALLLLIIFIVQNSRTVEVSFIIASVETRLVWALLFAAVLGLAIGLLWPNLRRRRE